MIHAFLNPIPGGGGASGAPPWGFLVISPKRVELGSSNFLTFPKRLLRNMSENFELIWPQVRSPEAVWWPYLRKVCNHARARVFDRSISSLQALVRVPVCAICISRNFDIGDLRSGQFRDLPIISQWGKNQLPVFTTKTGRNGPIYHTWLHIRSTFTTLRSVLLLGSCEVMWRHQRSPKVFGQ